MLDVIFIGRYQIYTYKLCTCGGNLNCGYCWIKYSQHLSHYVSQFPLQSLSSCGPIFICFYEEQLWLARINRVIYFSQSQLLLAKTNEDWTTSRKAVYYNIPKGISYQNLQVRTTHWYPPKNGYLQSNLTRRARYLC